MRGSLKSSEILNERNLTIRQSSSGKGSDLRDEKKDRTSEGVFVSKSWRLRFFIVVSLS